MVIMMKRKDYRRTAAAALTAAAILLSGCTGSGTTSEDRFSSVTTANGADTSASDGTAAAETTAAADKASAETSEAMKKSAQDAEEAVTTAAETQKAIAGATSITLTGGDARIDGGGASVSNGIVTISSAGTYAVSGTLESGQLVIDTDKESDVTVILNDASISCENSSAIYAKKADNFCLTLADGTSNFLSDGSSYVYASADEDEPNAALFSKCDLTVNGGGTLEITGNFKHAVFTKDDLVIAGGNITASAVKDGIKGRDSITVGGGTIDISAGEDGLRTTNEDESDKGYIVVTGGRITISAQQDGIQAITACSLTGGEIDITSGGGSGNAAQKSDLGKGGWGNWDTASTAESDTVSMKGIKSGTALDIGGTAAIEIDSADDAVHSNGSISIENGSLSASSGDDGIHADTSLNISGGSVDIQKSYEGLESAAITVSGGKIHVKASDDGLNAAGGADGSSLGGRPGQNSFTAGNQFISISGGYLYCDADGDGIDSNGAVTITGGTTLVNGPTNSGNGAMDYAGDCTISGGTLIAAGSSGMAQMPDTSSEQCSLMVVYSSQQSAGTAVTLTDKDGKALLSFSPAKTYNSIVISSPELIKGQSYTVYSGGTQNSSSDGYSEDGAESVSRVTDVTLTEISTAVTDSGSAYSGGFMGVSQGMGGFGGGRGDMGGGMQPPDGFGEGMQPPDGFGGGERPALQR